MKFYLSSKIHNIVVTDKNIEYVGSVTIDSEIIKEAGLSVFEKVQVVNLNTGDRWETYVIEGEPGRGDFALNGGSARCGEIGDRCLVMAYEMTDQPVPKIVFIGKNNSIFKACEYNNELDYFLNIGDNS